MINFLSTCILSSLTLFSLSSSLNAQQADTDKGEVMFVLDGSGSMWGQIEGKHKITIAKDVMTDLITNWDQNSPMGLTVYGHRKKGECTDIEIVSLPGFADRQKLIDRVQTINPKGKTPITDSVRLAAGAMGVYTGAKSSIVVVSDGLETCGGDPCALAKTLRTLNKNFTMHVVGFDVTQEEFQTLQCMATETGGKFFRANNANELKDALAQTVAAVGGGVAPIQSAPAKSLPTKDPEPAGFIYAKLCETCDRLAPLDGNWNVNKDGAPFYTGLGVIYPSDEQFEPGTYSVSVRYTATALTGSGEISIGADGKQIDAFNLNGGNAVLNAFATDDKNISASPILYEFFPIKDGEVGPSFTANAANNNNTWLPAGKYKVVATHQSVKADTQIDIVAGQQTDHTFDLRVGYIQPQFLLSAGEERVNGGLHYELFKAGTNTSVVHGVGFFDNKKALKPGDYILHGTYTSSLGLVTRKFPITIKTGEILNRKYVLNAGRFNYEIKTPTGPNEFFFVRLYSVDENGKNLKQIAGNINRKQSGVAPPGRYRFVMALGLINPEKHNSDPFEIIAGQTQTITVTIP